MFYKLLNVFLVLLLFMVACRSGRKTEVKTFDVGKMSLLEKENCPYVTVDIDDAEEMAYGDLIDSIRYVLLGNEYGEIGTIRNVITYKGRFYIQEDQFDRIFIYDESGRCLKKIDDKGRGPGEYLRIENIDIDKERNELIAVDGMSDRLFFYDLDGNFKYIRRIQNAQTQQSLCMKDSTFIHLMAPFQNVNNSELKGYALLLSKGDKNLYKGFPFIPLQIGNRGGGQIFKGDSRTCYHPLYSDTIYQISSDSTYCPIYYFKMKHAGWRKYQNFDRFVNMNSLEEGIKPWLFENKYFLLGYIADVRKTEQLKTVLYDRIKCKTYLLDWCDYNVSSELKYFEGYDVVGMNEDWFIVLATYSTFEMNNIFERVKNGSLKITDPKLEKIIKNFTTDSNPVLILTKFKHL